MGHLVSSPEEQEKRDRRDSRRDEREGQGRKRNRNESEETANKRGYQVNRKHMLSVLIRSTSARCF